MLNNSNVSKDLDMSKFENTPSNDYDLTLFFRPVIPWLLECDTPHTKESSFVHDAQVVQIRNSTTDYLHLPDRSGTIDHFSKCFT